MRVEVHVDVESVAQKAAEVIANSVTEGAAERGRFFVGVSGGRTPWLMLRALAGMRVPWRVLHVVQVDERFAPAGHVHRNLTQLEECLVKDGPLRPEQVHSMPVESSNPDAAAAEYAADLRRLAGTPPEVDLVHLGLGSDGHTASLVPGDPALTVDSADVALSGEYQGRRRMTLTYPILNRARRILWVVTGKDKAEMVNRLVDGDPLIPAGRVCRHRALPLADRAAAGSADRANGRVKPYDGLSA